MQHITKLLWASRAYETGPAIVMKWLIIHSTIATPEIARGAVIGEQDWMVELPVRSPPPHMDELKKEYLEKKSKTLYIISANMILSDGDVREYMC